MQITFVNINHGIKNVHKSNCISKYTNKKKLNKQLKRNVDRNISYNGNSLTTPTGNYNKNTFENQQKREAKKKMKIQKVMKNSFQTNYSFAFFFNSSPKAIFLA